MEPVTQASSTTSPVPLSPLEQSELILKAVREARVESQQQLREQLQQLRQDEEQRRTSGQTPLHVFPQEIWEMILRNLKVNDLANCSRACPSFSRMIKFTPQQLLFGKVLPLLKPHFNHKFPYHDCRLVCRKWRAAIEDFVHARGRVEVPLYTALEALTKEPEPDARHTEDGGHYWSPEKWNIETAKPPAPTFYKLSAINIRMFRTKTNPPPTTLSTLSVLGHRVWRLDLELRGNYTSQKLYTWCLTALEKCAQLKVLRLICMGPGTVVNDGVDDQLKLKMGTNLEHLVIDHGIQGIEAVQNKLLREFSWRLKSIYLGLWNTELYKEYPWTNLTDATFLGDMDKTCLWEMDFPKLHKISLILDSRCELTLLFKVINKFGSLRNLSLWLNNGIDTWNVPHLELLTSNRISTLDITSNNINQTRDIPCLFPMIRHLMWCCKVFGAAGPDTEFCIQISRNMYESNIWNVLPHLQKLILQHKTHVIDKEEKRTFTREEYIYRTQNYSNGIEGQLGRIHEHMKAARRELVKKKMAEDKVAIENSAQVKSSRKDALHEQAFPFIIPHLASSDILKCRRVCKTWTRLVGDSHLENCKHYPLYQFYIPMATPQRIEKFKGFVEQHQEEPFFGWSVELEIKEGSKISYVRSLLTLLGSLGSRIRFLTLSTKVLAMMDTLRILHKCLKYCPNLRGLSLNIAALKYSDRKKSYKIQLEGFSQPPNLTWISACGPQNGNLLPFYQLLEKLEIFARHITVWKQDQSCEGEHAILSPKLKEWTVRKYETESLSQGKTYPWKVAENLERLHICITGQQLSLTDLKEIALRYKKLRFLELQFTDAFSGLKQSLIHYDFFGQRDKDKFGQLFDEGVDGEEEMQNQDCLHKVTELQLVFRNKYQTSLDFLILFPEVKTLRIVYGRHASLLNEESTWTPEDKEQTLFDSLPTRGTSDKDFIQLVKHFKDKPLAEHNSAGIYASNIWSVLGKLQTLQVVCCAEERKNDKTLFKRKM